MPHGDHRLDVPRTLRELYPLARARSRARVALHVERTAVPRGGRLLASLRAFLLPRLVTLGIAAAVLLLAQGTGAGVDSVAVRFVADALTVSVFVVTAWLLVPRVELPAWHRWARVRGMRRIRHLRGETATGELLDVHGASCYVGAVGRRRVPVELLAARQRQDDRAEGRRDVAVCMVHVQLPAGAGDLLPWSTLERDGDSLEAAPGGSGSRRHRTESIAFERSARLTVSGDELDWTQVLDPALVDLLSELPDVGWVQRGELLTVYACGPRSILVRPDAARLDTLCLVAAAVERRVARLVGRGSEVPPAQPAFAAGLAVDAEGMSRRARARYLRQARRLDLGMSIDEQLVELGRYVPAEELERVRAALDAGSLRADHLDDLLHHRRARFWGVSDAA